MASSIFRFKQFSIHQDRCAMKVGTDGVLLGAWCGQKEQPQRILDIGTGTGTIALMVAQRFPNASVTALEIDPRAAQQAAENASKSPFADRIEVVQANIFDWQANRTFDLIVCNPPYYPNGPQSATPERTTARHAGSFSINTLLEKAVELSHSNSTLSLVLPQHLYCENDFAARGWYAKRTCFVRPNRQKLPHRILSDCGPKVSKRNISDLIIEEGGRHQYSAEYRQLTNDFYLKF